MRTLKLSTYTDSRTGLIRARVIAGNGKILARTTRGYSREQLDKRIDTMLVKEYDADLYKDVAGEWRWRWRFKGVKTNEIFMVSSEGYQNRGDCKHASDLVLDTPRSV